MFIPDLPPTKSKQTKTNNMMPQEKSQSLGLACKMSQEKNRIAPGPLTLMSRAALSGLSPFFSWGRQSEEPTR